MYVLKTAPKKKTKEIHMAKGNAYHDIGEGENSLISVIVPIYNVEKYLCACLNSILEQSYQNMEIILVDDGSTDGSAAICDRYAQQDKRIKVIHQKNGGLSFARNCGLKHRTGTFLAFVDSDDEIEPDFLQTAVNLLKKQNLDAVMVEASLINEDGIKGGNRFHVFDEYTVLPAQKVLEMIIDDSVGSQVWKGVYRSYCWDGIEFPVGRFYEDIATTFKVYAKMTHPVAFLPKQMYRYRLRSGGISLSGKNLTTKVYHIFLSQREQFLYGRDHCKQETVEICFTNTVSTAGRVLLLFGNNTVAFKDAYLFIRKEWKRILRSRCLKTKMKAKLLVMTMPYGSVVVKSIGRIVGHKYVG